MHPLDQEESRVIRYPAHQERMPCTKAALEARTLEQIFEPNEWLTGKTLNTSYQAALAFMLHGLSIMKTMDSGKLRYSSIGTIGKGSAYTKRLKKIFSADYKGRLLRFYQDHYVTGKLPSHITLRWLLDPTRVEKWEQKGLTEPRRMFCCQVVQEMLEACHGSAERASRQYSVPLNVINFWNEYCKL